jgi:hypothetical protein
LNNDDIYKAEETRLLLRKLQFDLAAVRGLVKTGATGAHRNPPNATKPVIS